MKSAQIQSYFWSVFFCIQSEYRKIRTRNNSVFGSFSRSSRMKKPLLCTHCSHYIESSHKEEKTVKLTNTARKRNSSHSKSYQVFIQFTKIFAAVSAVLIRGTLVITFCNKRNSIHSIAKGTFLLWHCQEIISIEIKTHHI